ncbi:MAG: hypothetical protein KatS3mg032_0153 [Cyclobacteriaceae bacterium]|nr:MAG: hypothetical protein KatS3mg032_0153 [Cyclobacteriaceae bacterium]
MNSWTWKPRELNDLELNFRLQPVEVGTTVTLKTRVIQTGHSGIIARIV